MTHRLPFAMRARISRVRQARYRTDPAYRLARLNEARIRRGQPPATDLSQCRLRVPVDDRGE